MRTLTSLLLLVILAVAVWFGARAFVHRGEVRATVIVDDAGDLRANDPVVRNDDMIGRVDRINPLDRRTAVTVRIDRKHRRDLLSDSMFEVRDHQLAVVNTLAVGAPVDDGAILEAKQDRVSRWLAHHGTAMASFVDAARAKADDLIDTKVSRWNDQVPEWKREGSTAFAQHLDEAKRQMNRAEDELRAHHHVEEAKRLKERFNRWISDVTR